MPARKRSKSKSKRRTRRKRKSKRKAQIKRPYKLDKASRARHRYRKGRHKKSAVHGHHKRQHDEALMTNYLLHQLLKTAASTDADPYSYEPRDHSRDPEYKFSGKAMQEFKRAQPAGDVHFWRPQGKGMPTHTGNFPGWRPKWVHTYQHPHAAPLGVLVNPPAW